MLAMRAKSERTARSVLTSLNPTKAKRRGRGIGRCLLSQMETTPDKLPRAFVGGEAEPGDSEITNRRWELAGARIFTDRIDAYKVKVRTSE
jgi:hypothetical protein